MAAVGGSGDSTAPLSYPAAARCGRTRPRVMMAHRWRLSTMPSGYPSRVFAVLTSLLPLVAAACASTATAPPPAAAPPAQATAVATSAPAPTPVALESVRTGLNG